MGKSVLLRGLTAAILAALVGCHYLTPPLRPDVAGVAGGAAMSPSGAASERATGLTITGRVDFPSLRKAQATSADVVGAATVSLIDTSTQNTVASGKTDATGNFTVALGSYSPGTQAYVLEAVKGLSSHNPGADAARFRTILKFSGGAWASCTNAVPGVGSIVINSHTTALAIQSALDPVNVPPLNTIGKVNVATVPATFVTPMGFAGHPDTEFDNLAADLLNFLSADADPVASVTSIKPTISAFEPASALPNALVRITGTGFSPSLSGNTVTFGGGQVASVVLSTPNSMVVVVPAGATSGTVQVRTARGTVTSSSAFNVLAAAAGGQTLSIASFTPSYGRPGTRVTLTGQFGSTQGAVYFAGPSSTQVPGKVVTWTANTIEVDVPVSAQYGRITVAVGANSASSATDFDTWQGDLGYLTNVYSNAYGVYTVPHSSYGQSTVVYGSPTAKYIYVVAGTDNTVGSQGPYTNGNGGFNVFMWPVSADGTLGPAKWVGRLNIPRYEATAVIAGNFLYVIGGYDGQPAATYAGFFGPQLRSIERATINPADGTLSKSDGTKGAFDQLGDLLQTNGRYQHRSFVGTVGGTTYIWCVGGYSATGGNGRTDYEQFSVNTTTGALTPVRAAPLQGPSGIFSIYRFGAQLIGTGILIAGGIYNGGYWGGSMTIPINQTDGSLGTGVAGPNAVNCPSYSGSYGKYGGQLARVGSKVYWFSGYHPSVGYFNEVLQATVNTTNGQISGNWACASAGAPNSSARNQVWNTNWNDQHAVIQNGGINRIYSFGGNNASYYIQHTEVLSDGSLTRFHALGSTRDQFYYAATIALGNKAWVIGGYRNDDGVYTDTSEYYVMRDDGIITAPTMGPKLSKPRYHPVWTTAKGYLYIIGGYNPSEGALDTVERAQINADGTLGAFTVMPYRLNVRNYQGAAINIGNYLYVVGGVNQAGTPIATIERAVVNADGTTGPWEIMQTYLPYTVYGHALRQIGNFVYLLAGNGGSISTNYVLRAQVYPDGSLGAFTRPSISDQSVTGAWGAGVEVFGNYLYRCFGNGDQSNCYRTFINADGTLGNWGLWQPMGRAILPGNAYDTINHAIYRWNDRVFWLSGQNSGRNIYAGTLR